MQNLLLWIFMSGLCRVFSPIFALEPPLENMSCFLSKQMENQCGLYCHKAMKPLLEVAQQSLQKDVKLAKLEEQLSELKRQLSIYKERESQNQKLLEMAANVVAIKEQLSNMESKFQQTTEKVLIEEPHSCVSSGSGLQKIKVPGMEPFSVSCNNEIAGPGWILIQQRLNGSRNFNRSWDAYRDGFGDLNAEFFIGLEKLHQILKSQPHELYIRMEKLNKKIYYAHYDHLSVSDENSAYKLNTLGIYSGNTTDALRRNLGMKFSTYDRDNDQHTSANCARIHKDGWWHSACSDCNLNGIYNDATSCIFWYYPDLKRNSDCLKTVQILIRPKVIEKYAITLLYT